MAVQTTAGGIPVLILREGTKENKGREAQMSITRLIDEHKKEILKEIPLDVDEGLKKLL